MKKFTFTIIAMLGILCQTMAQQQAVGRGRLFTTDGETVQFESLTIGEVEHQFRATPGAAAHPITVDKVVRIEQQTGTEAGKWALWVGAAGLVGSALGVMQANNQNEANGFETSHSADAPIIIGLTAASAGIGALIGAGKKKYETVHTNPKYGAVQPSWRVNLLASQNGGGVALRVSF